MITVIVTMYSGWGFSHETNDLLEAYSIYDATSPDGQIREVQIIGRDGDTILQRKTKSPE